MPIQRIQRPAAPSRVQEDMELLKKWRRGMLIAQCVLLAGVLVGMSASAVAQTGADGGAMPPGAEELFALANQSRAQAGAGKLEWDAALAEAAMRHCRRMVAEGPIAHRYGGEADLTERAAQAGAHFSLIEENVAVGSYAGLIHRGWLESPHHRENLLNPAVNRVGIAVVASQGVLYAVADYAESAPVLTREQVEASIAGLLRGHGVWLRDAAGDARAACALDSGLPRALVGDVPSFVMRWQGSDVTTLPSVLTGRLAGKIGRFAVGSCPARGMEGTFTVYRVALLFYERETEKTQPKS